MIAKCLFEKDGGLRGALVIKMLKIKIKMTFYVPHPVISQIAL